MPSTSFDDIPPDNTYVPNPFYGDWDDIETVLLTWSRDARLSDFRLSEGFSASYPYLIPPDATVTNIRVSVLSNTVFGATSTVDCSLAYYETEYGSALSTGPNVTDELQQFDFNFSDDGIVTEFITDIGGPQNLNDYGFGCFIYTRGGSGTGGSPDIQYISVPYIDVEFNTPDGEYVVSFRRRRRS